MGAPVETHIVIMRDRPFLIQTSVRTRAMHEDLTGESSTCLSHRAAPWLPHRQKDRSLRLHMELGFVRHDLYILIAVVLIALAIILPRFVQHGLRAGLIASLYVAGAVAGGIGILFLATWLLENTGREGSGWGDRALRGFGGLLRFLLFGLTVTIIVTALVSGHALAVDNINLVSLVAAGFGGLCGSLLYRHLGPTRFWPPFRQFCLTLLGSFVGGVIGMIGGVWWTDIGILAPILIFMALIITGRIVPPMGAAEASSLLPPMSFDIETSEMIRRAVAEGRDDLLYAMVSADDGGQTYEMKCQICHALGNVLSSGKFRHSQDCPVALEEEKKFTRNHRE